MSKKEVEKPNEQKNGNQKVEQKQESPEVQKIIFVKSKVVF